MIDNIANAGTILEAGKTYNMAITSVEDIHSQNGTPGYTITLKTADGATLWENVYVTPNTGARRKQIAVAAGVPIKNDSFDTNDLIGKSVAVTLYEDEYNNKTKMKVKTWMQASEKVNAAPDPTPAVPDKNADIPF